MPLMDSGLTQTGSDRRRSARHRLADGRPVTATAAGRLYSCTIEDVSCNGLRLHFERGMPRGNVVALDHPTAGMICGACVWRDGTSMGIDIQIPKAELERVLTCVSLVL